MGALLLAALGVAAVALGAPRNKRPEHDVRRVPDDVIAMTFVEVGPAAHPDEVRGILEVLDNRRELYSRRAPVTHTAIVRSNVSGRSVWGWDPPRYAAALQQWLARRDEARFRDEWESRRRLAAKVFAGERRLPFRAINFVHPERIANKPGPRKAYDSGLRRYLPKFSVPIADGGTARHVYDQRATTHTRYSVE